MTNAPFEPPVTLEPLLVFVRWQIEKCPMLLSRKLPLGKLDIFFHCKRCQASGNHCNISRSASLNRCRYRFRIQRNNSGSTINVGFSSTTAKKWWGCGGWTVSVLYRGNSRVTRASPNRWEAPISNSLGGAKMSEESEEDLGIRKSKNTDFDDCRWDVTAAMKFAQ